MKALKEFIDQSNNMSQFFGGTVYDINNLSQYDVEEIAASLDCKASPENLWCDGEISRTKAMAKLKFLQRVIKDLKKVGKPFVTYEI
jgi:hypothetical protein